MKRFIPLFVGAALLAACSKSDQPSDDKKTSPLVDLINKTASVDSASTLAPLLEARGFQIVSIRRVPAQLSGRRATAAVYRSGDGARGGILYMQRLKNEADGVSWHWYFADGAPDSLQMLEINDDGLWDVRVFMAGGTTRDFIQGETFSFMSDREAIFAMNGASSAIESWKAFDGDTTTAWRAPSEGAFIDIPLPMGIGDGKLSVRVASGSRTNKLEIFAGDKKVQDVELQNTNEFQSIQLDAALQQVPAIRVVVEGPAATVAISELEIR